MKIVLRTMRGKFKLTEDEMNVVHEYCSDCSIRMISGKCNGECVDNGLRKYPSYVEYVEKNHPQGKGVVEIPDGIPHWIAPEFDGTERVIYNTEEGIAYKNAY